MTYADYQNTEPAFQDGPSDDGPITVTLNLTDLQVLTLRNSLLESRNLADYHQLWDKVSHVRELLLIVDKAIKQ
jgi:hypothetical protein